MDIQHIDPTYTFAAFGLAVQLAPVVNRVIRRWLRRTFVIIVVNRDQ